MVDYKYSPESQSYKSILHQLEIDVLTNSILCHLDSMVHLKVPMLIDEGPNFDLTEVHIEAVPLVCLAAASKVDCPWIDKNFLDSGYVENTNMEAADLAHLVLNFVEHIAVAEVRNLDRES